jgi:hypothetical protein
MFDQAVAMYVRARNSHYGENVPPSTFSQIQQLFGNPSWMNHHSIFNHVQSSNPPFNVAVSVEHDTNDTSTLSILLPRNKGGCPSNMETTTINKWQDKIKEAKLIAADLDIQVKKPTTSISERHYQNVFC